MTTIIWLDPTTGDSVESASFSASDSDLVTPAPTMAPAGTTYTIYGDRAPNVRVYGPVTTTARTMLRQRQSPLRTPSRVRPIDLRQRQSPFIT